MKVIANVLCLCLLISCAHSTEIKYTASTPAAPLVRNFLGISLTDSIDFIRWNLSLEGNQYSLKCNYGIGKPNTNGFINGGKKIEFNGEYREEKNVYLLQNKNQSLKLAELNANLLHILNNDNNLLIGNGGWSYTLNNLAPALTDQLNLPASQTRFKDSLVFEGRTPCGVPGIIQPGKECYKLKWWIVLYAGGKESNSGKYYMLGTPWYEQGGKRGNWKLITRQDGKIIYQLNDETNKPFIHLLKLDNGVVIFTDLNGNLLVGDHDFSYTLNRTFRKF